MALAGEAVRRIAKAVASGIGGIVTVGTAAASLIALVPANMLPFAITASTILGAVEVVRTVGVWITRNGPKIADVVDEAEDLYGNVVEAVGNVTGKHAAEAPAPAAPVDLRDIDLPGVNKAINDVVRTIESAVPRITVPGPA